MSRGGIIHWAFLVGTCALTLPVALFGQSSIGQSSIVGTVVDPTGAAISGARIAAVQPGTSALREARTDNSGRFLIPNLPIGIYTLRCEKTGFQTVEVEDVSLSINQTLEERIEMQVGPASENVEVKAQPEALATTAPNTSVALGGERIDDDPAQNRNYLNFVLLAPGVTRSAHSNALRALAGLRSPEEDSGFSFGGMRPRNNGLYIDGLDNRDVMTGGNRVAVSLDMVQEFQVSSSEIAPEFGGAAGGNVNVVTLSGTNKWHGDASLYFENEFANARDPEIELPIKPYFHRYQEEASIAGPLRKDRTFVSATAEQESESTQEDSDVGQAGALPEINAALASPAFARAATRKISESLFPTSSSSTLFAFKLNHQLNPTSFLFARYAFSRGDVSHEVFGTNNFPDQSALGSSLTRDQSFAAGWTAVPNTTFSSQLRLQFARRSVDLTPNSQGALIEIPGVMSFGQTPQMDGATTGDYYQAVESLTLIRGSHQIGVGFSGQYIGFNNRLPNRFAGIYIFPTLTDFLQARPDVFIQRFGNPETRYSTVPLGAWLQDQWQPGAGVTIVAGIRLDAQRLPNPIPSAANNWSPRFGIAWHPGNSPWVFRGTFGLFYDECYPFSWFNDAIQVDGDHAFEQYAVGATATQAFAVAQGGTLDTPLAGVAHSIYRPASNLPSTYSRQVTAGVERGFSADTTLSVEYLNVHGFHLPRIRNINGTLPPLYQLEDTASSSYQGLTIALNRRLSHELTYLVSYTESRAHDDASDFDEQPLNPNNTRLDWARSRQYQAHRFVGSGIFELPFEDIQTAPRWLRRFSHEFEFGPIVTVGRPQPINALESTDLYRTGAYPISARPLGLARNPFFNRGVVSVDLRVSKGFVLAKDRGLLTVGVDVYNLLNRWNPLLVSPYYSDGINRLPSYGGLVESLGARQLEFTLEWEF